MRRFEVALENEDPAFLPLVFCFAEERRESECREPGRETDVLTNEQYSDTD